MKRAMARDGGTAIIAGMRSVAMAALVFACAAQAQNPGSVDDYRLPPAPSPAAPAAQGPVDSQNPVARPSTPAPASPSTQEPSAQPAAVPRIELPEAPSTAAPAGPQRVQRRERPVATQALPTPAAAPTDTTDTAVTTEAAGPPVALPAPVPAPAADTPAASASGTRPDVWLAVAAGGALLAAAIGILLWRRRKPTPTPADEPMFEAPAVDAPAIEPEPASPAATPAPNPAPPPFAEAASRPMPHPAFAAPPLDIQLTVETLRLSVVYATLSYRLTLTNPGQAPLGTLRISGDLASGHASLPIGQQLLLDGDGLDGQHELPGLAPGETAALKGELRLPLAQVIPLRAGSALFFAPLARFLIEAGGKDEPGANPSANPSARFSESRVFTVGLPSDRPGGSMQPLRLDLGPQLFRELDQREIDLAQWLPLDAARRAG